MRKHVVRWPASIGWIALVLTAAACSAAGTGVSPSIEPQNVDLTIISRDLAFDQESLATSSGSTWSLQLVNEDAAPHNVAIYTDASAAESLFVGELVSSTTIVYQVPALEPGTYFFRCDLHPEMNGTLVVDGGVAGVTLLTPQDQRT